MMKQNPLSLIVLISCALIIGCDKEEDQLDITGITFTSSGIEVVEGTSVNLEDYYEVSGTDADQAQLTFSSDDTDIVSVDGTTLTAAGIGSTKVTATESNSGLSASADVTVVPNVVAVTGIALDKAEANIKVGETFLITATITPEDATEKGVTWSVAFPAEGKNEADSPTDIATVSDEGLVTAISAGDVVVTATTKDGEFSASVDIAITNVAVTGVSLSTGSEIVEIDGTETIQLSATIAPENAFVQDVSWTVDFTDAGDQARVNADLSPEDYATIDENGAITGGHPCAECVIVTATVVDGDNTFTASANITVNRVEVTSITLNPSSFTVDPDATQQLTVTVLPVNASPNDKLLYWSLAYEFNLCDVPPVSNYAAVDQDGVVSGIAAFGCSNIIASATSENGEGSIVGTSSFTVNTILMTSLSIRDSDGLAYDGKAVELDACIFSEYQLYTTASPENTSDNTVTWSLTSGMGASVNSSTGLLTIDSYGGTARFTATANDGSGQTDYIDVTVDPCL